MESSWTMAAPTPPEHINKSRLEVARTQPLAPKFLGQGAGGALSSAAPPIAWAEKGTNIKLTTVGRRRAAPLLATLPDGGRALGRPRLPVEFCGARRL